jgi:hypothetical protein
MRDAMLLLKVRRHRVELFWNNRCAHQRRNDIDRFVRSVERIDRGDRIFRALEMINQ